MDFEKFYNKCLHFLSFRPRSEKEIRDYLAKKKVSEEVSQKIIAKLKEYKFVDDFEFTKWWIEQRTRIKPKSWWTIKFELKQKGISSELIENSEIETPNDLETAKKLAEKKLRSISNKEDKQKTKEKLGRFLASKGFDWGIIRKSIDDVLSEIV